MARCVLVFVMRTGAVVPIPTNIRVLQNNWEEIELFGTKFLAIPTTDNPQTLICAEEVAVVSMQEESQIAVPSNGRITH